jgi:hypothetical protein
MACSGTALAFCFRFNVYNCFKSCPSLLETAGIRVPIRHFLDFHFFICLSSHKTCPSARRASAAKILIFIYTFLKQKEKKLSHIRLKGMFRI